MLWVSLIGWLYLNVVLEWLVEILHLLSLFVFGSDEVGALS